MQPRYDPSFLGAWRRHRGLTQQQLADRMGVSKAEVSRVETGERGYRQSFIEKAAKALQCTPAQIVGADPTETDGAWNIYEAVRRLPANRLPDVRRIVDALSDEPAAPPPKSARK